VCIGGHTTSWVLIIILSFLGVPITQTYKEWVWALLGAIGPDIADIFRWFKLKHPLKNRKFFYRKKVVTNKPYLHILESADMALHSIWALIIVIVLVMLLQFIPWEFALMYIIHVMIDNCSHKEHLFFWPMNKINISLTDKNWWEWSIYKIIKIDTVAWILGLLSLCAALVIFVIRELP